MSTKFIEIAHLWRRGRLEFHSAEIMDGRIADLTAMMQEGPVVLLIRPNLKRRSEKSPVATLLAMVTSPRRNPGGKG